jgi:hypothetical protein
MATTSQAVSVGAAAVALLIADNAYGWSVPGVTRRVVIQNLGAADVFIGGADVTSANGVKIAANAVQVLDLETGDRLYAIQAAGATANSDVRVLNLGV